MKATFEHVRLTESQQQARHRQHGDGQHERAAHLLQSERDIFFMTFDRFESAFAPPSARAVLAIVELCR